MLPLHESVSRSIAAKYIRMMFRIQQAENKPRLSRRIFVKPPLPEKFPAKPKYFLSRPKLKTKPAYRSRPRLRSLVKYGPLTYL